jgi:divalent metal cation (Fe/Co/Zn/Cd) transporter
MSETRRSESSSLESNAEQRPQARVAASSRVSLIAAALRLSFFTIAWNGLIGASGFVVALFTGSLALAGFALTAVLDSSASAVLVWRFMHERRDPLAAERVERRAQAVVAMAMMAVGLYVAVQAVRALAGRSHTDESALGFVVATVSVLVLPWLGRQKLRVAAALPSAALRGDGVLTLAAAGLAAITLLALYVSSALGWWWADPAAALIIAIGLAAEGLRVAIRHRFG